MRKIHDQEVMGFTLVSNMPEGILLGDSHISLLSKAAYIIPYSHLLLTTRSFFVVVFFLRTAYISIHPTKEITRFV